MSNPLDSIGAPHGATAPARDIVPVSAPATDEALATPARSFLVLTSGTVSVTTLEGNDRTFDVEAGLHISCAITHVLAATTADILAYVK
ncbi:spike base protein, RCAP_Rcc01079 family [Leisingera sp. ANG-Vp]|uniref:spike base protein, RCAP_Rcc01079 family n=1 Tax=Leisingera sp. ANG-Vp TaxID=1577896 RepID=UPI00057F5875|nr:hypothetical protein RA20_01090 [Leisingera sp. ANG-Vp]